MGIRMCRNIDRKAKQSAVRQEHAMKEPREENPAPLWALDLAASTGKTASTGHWVLSLQLPPLESRDWMSLCPTEISLLFLLDCNIAPHVVQCKCVWRSLRGVYIYIYIYPCYHCVYGIQTLPSTNSDNVGRLLIGSSFRPSGPWVLRVTTIQHFGYFISKKIFPNIICHSLVQTNIHILSST